MSAEIRRVNLLRAARTHLEAQTEAKVDLQQATYAQALDALAAVMAELAELEPPLRELPEAAYLFSKGRKRRAGRKAVAVPRLARAPESDNGKENSMARKSKAAVLEETRAALRRAEKSAGSTRWALSGAGAAKNPPSAERAAALEEKLARETALVAELRTTRDELAAKS